MDKMKLLNLFIFAFAASLLVQLVFFPPKDTTLAQSWVLLQIKDDAITVPNIPVIEVVNQSTGSIVVNPCTDIKISLDSLWEIKNIGDTAPTFCNVVTVEAGATGQIPFGPLYEVFAKYAGKYIVTLNTEYGERIVFFESEKPGIIRTFLSATVYQPIYNLFVALLTWIPGHPLGWAIIIVTIIIRLILLVPQHHMLEWQKKLQKIQPKIKALQKEYKEDQATLGMKMLELYKTEWVNPMGSIVPLLIQMPILIGLYWVISQINDPSNFYHLYSFFQNFDPTEIVTQFYWLELSQIGGTLGIIFALALGALQYIQARLSFAYTEKKKEKEDTKALVKKDDETPDFALDPALMQKMMLYFFPIMIAVSSFFFPLGVGLYWFIGTLFVIGQQAYVNRKH
jgi:YidC/Oxa1 family membrane protein insertase